MSILGTASPEPREALSALACVPAIDRYLDELTSGRPEPLPLRDAVRYALLGGGKRVRPALAWHACVSAGGRSEDSLPGGAAVELVHAFSLVHDDLPALDNDDLRRGRPTLHIHAGEALAILAGDALLALAFQVLAERVDPPSLAGTLARELADATAAMIAGQVQDMQSGARRPSGSAPAALLPVLERLHRNKTGALIRASCRMGALLGGARAGSERLAAVTSFAEHLGLMFQIVDDLLDVEHSSEQTGKRTRKDADAGKLTYPAVLGVAASRAEVERLRETAMRSIAEFGREASGLRQMCDLLASRTR